MSLRKTFRTVFMISSKSSIVTLERNLVIIVDLIQTKTKKVCSGNEQCLEILLYFLIRVPFLLCDSCTLFFVLKPFMCLTLFPPSLSHLLSHWEKKESEECSHFVTKTMLKSLFSLLLQYMEDRSLFLSNSSPFSCAWDSILSLIVSLSLFLQLWFLPVT